MAQNVFNAAQIKQKNEEFKLQLVHDFSPKEEIKEENTEQVYTGPTIEELEKEAADFRAKFEEEKREMLKKAQDAADEIVKKAEEAAFSEVKKQTDQAQIIKTDAENEAQKIISDAKAEAQKILENAKIKEEEIKMNASKNGYEEGRAEGFSSGKDEVARLIERIHKILDEVMSRREEILSSTENQIVDLVVLIARKVIKTLSENQKEIVLENVRAALKKISTRGTVSIRVNLADLNLATEHTADFLKMVEGAKNVFVLEDSSIERGGCIVETDFGAVDARISRQLSILEEKIIAESPIKKSKEIAPISNLSNDADFEAPGENENAKKESFSEGATFENAE